MMNKIDTFVMHSKYAPTMSKDADKSSIFNFHNTYTQLPEIFYSKIKLKPVPRPELVLFNEELAEELNLKIENRDSLPEIFSGNRIVENSALIAQAYAGHQFGHFTMLGDGRAVLLGEHITEFGKKYDIQLKGSGQTPYSRGGDGKAVLKPMLKEYLFSESLHHLGVPTSRSLAVVKTEEKVYRTTSEPAAILTRVFPGHIRVGTFQFARFMGEPDDLEKLLNYTIERHFPEIKNTENPALALLDTVMHLQIELIVNWMRIGFIHGVMNTDNTAICGEAFDFGPCAFMGVYHPRTVFSSIDTNGRYSFGNQPQIIKWNLARFAETLLERIHPDQDKALKIATDKINAFDALFNQYYYQMMLGKIGIEFPIENDWKLVDELLILMRDHQKDYTHTFNFLRLPEMFENKDFTLGEEFEAWISKWEKRLLKDGGKSRASSVMERYNPVYIPRNYFVEQALNQAVEGDFTPFYRLLDNMKYCYYYMEDMNDSLFAPENFDSNFQTTCGT